MIFEPDISLKYYMLNKFNDMMIYTFLEIPEHDPIVMETSSTEIKYSYLPGSSIPSMTRVCVLLSLALMLIAAKDHLLLVVFEFVHKTMLSHVTFNIPRFGSYSYKVNMKYQNVKHILYARG